MASRAHDGTLRAPPSFRTSKPSKTTDSQHPPNAVRAAHVLAAHASVRIACKLEVSGHGRGAARASLDEPRRKEVFELNDCSDESSIATDEKFLVKRECLFVPVRDYFSSTLRHSRARWGRTPRLRSQQNAKSARLLIPLTPTGRP